MKRVTILIPFRDKGSFKTVYNPGEVKEFDDDRAAALAARGLVEIDEPAEETAEDEPKTDTKPDPRPKGKTSSKGAKGKSSKKDAKSAEPAEEAEVETGDAGESDAKADETETTDKEAE